jgi:exodeoxyribonuclease V alpha subunit
MTEPIGLTGLPPESPEQALAAGFAQHVGRWARERGGPPAAVAAVCHAARALSERCAAAEVCIALTDVPRGPDWPDDPRRARALLRASGIVGSGADPGANPLVLDEADRLYLHRYYDDECRLARRLRALRDARPDPERLGPRLRERLSTLFAANAAVLGDAPDWQRIAVALALTEGLAVISGGPGTGKTTTVVNLLACLIEADPNCRIALAAPTGKAAARMAEAIRERARHLPPEIAARLPTEAQTVHRLLRSRTRGGFLHGSDHPLAIDALIVDEASMLDLALAARLLEAVPDGARVILLGDRDQLAAVEAGAVFADLSRDAHLSAACRARVATLAGIDAQRIVPPSPEPGPLPDSVIWLTRTWRFAADSRIGEFARLVVEGRHLELQPWIDRDEGPHAQLRLIVDDPRNPHPDVVEGAMQGFAAYAAQIAHGETDPGTLMHAFQRFRVLCAVRDGSRGTDALNAAIVRRLADPDAPRGLPLPIWYRGRPVMVLRNDYTLRLFNGDVGITTVDAQGAFVVCFPAADGTFRTRPPSR